MRSRFLLPGLLLALTMALGLGNGHAQAAEGKKKAAKKAKAQEAPKEEPLVWPSPLDPGQFDPFLTELTFGKSREDFQPVLEARVAEQAAPLMRATLDPVERDALKERLDKTARGVLESWTEFTGQDSGYRISVIADDFKSNASEGVLRNLSGTSSSYFLFSGGKLWKLVVCSEDEGTFADLLARLTKLYGKPREVQEKRGVTQAMWQDGAFRLTAASPSGLLRCNQLRWVYRPMEPEVEKLRNVSSDSERGFGSEATVEKVTSGDEEDVDDVVDRMLRQKQQPAPAPAPATEAPQEP
jgi:hypothetical protein